MITLLAVTLLCGTVCFVGYRAEVALSAKWRADRLSRDAQHDARLRDAVAARTRTTQLEQRRLDLAERELDLKEREFAKRSESPKRMPPMPEDLRARITAWEDEFAQSEERARLFDLYAEVGSWDDVRKMLPPLSPFLSTDNIAAPREGLIQ